MKISLTNEGEINNFFRQIKAGRVYLQTSYAKSTVKGRSSGKRNVIEKNLDIYKDVRSGKNDG